MHGTDVLHFLSLLVVNMAAEALNNVEGQQSEKKQGFCPVRDKQFPGEQMKQVWKECNQESFWYRALPLSVGSMAVTGGLIYQGVWKQSKRFGPFPKLALAGILGYAVGKASYIGTCKKRFQQLAPEFNSGQGWGPGFGPPGFASYRHRHCTHVCQECKKQEEAAASPATPTPTQS